ncbi:restriction endonuclease [Dickeya sp. Secpp 1600]|uniref:restriction endonuclease n=1 Tax=Dickeya sp. Secpp 1600 TaxID=2037915 RepID=UPI0021008079|nr:restriction endonuclease [Dickeya sp. Secpp 1600]
MPTLNWIGKEAVIKHHKDVPFRLLEHDADLSHGQDDSGNIIIQGDNLHALKALLPRYAGQVKCIYIDPLIILEMKVGYTTITSIALKLENG